MARRGDRVAPPPGEQRDREGAEGGTDLGRGRGPDGRLVLAKDPIAAPVERGREGPLRLPEARQGGGDGLLRGERADSLARLVAEDAAGRLLDHAAVEAEHLASGRPSDVARGGAPRALCDPPVGQPDGVRRAERPRRLGGGAVRLAASKVG